MRQKIKLTILMMGLSGWLNAQDVIQVMQYNLLNYGNLTSYCTSANNSALTKNGYFKTIFSYAKPDILTVNEMAENPIYQDSLLRNALNVDGETAYKRAELTPVSQGDWIVNMLYYNSRKLTLLKHDAINTIYRATDVYQLFYNAYDLEQTGDTLFLTCIVTHLKAGSTTSDAIDRTTMVNSIISYIQNNDMRHNYLFSGDFNLKSASENAYDAMIKDYDGTYYLYDPVDSPGDWYQNETFRFLHTQSPRTVYSECASNGGLDDRFDFIMASGALMSGTNGMQIIPSTYHALGNDGLHYNTSILAAPTNTSAPADVVSALYNGSDHLPVMVQINTEQSYLGLDENKYFAKVKFQNPVHHQLNLQIVFDQATNFEASIYDLAGRQLIQVSQSEKTKQHQLSIPIPELKSGVYFLQLKTTNGQQSVHKFFKD